jgi:hypothetical protein
MSARSLALFIDQRLHFVSGREGFVILFRREGLEVVFRGECRQNLLDALRPSVEIFDDPSTSN